MRLLAEGWAMPCAPAARLTLPSSTTETKRSREASSGKDAGSGIAPGYDAGNRGLTSGLARLR